MDKSGLDSGTEVDRFASDHPAETRAIIEKLRDVARHNLTGMQEILYHGAIGYSPSGLPHDRIVYILPAKMHVTLGFFFGAHLPDPDRLLTGEGKRMRHVKVRTIAEAESRALRDLVRAASVDSSESLQSLHKKWHGARKA